MRSMTFHEKLDLLLNMTHLTNSEVAQALNIDPSLVSRFRTGKRIPSPSSGYIDQLSSLIAGHITQEYQKTALSKLFEADYSPEEDTKEVFAPLLQTFLLDYHEIDSESIGMFFKAISLWEMNRANSSFTLQSHWNSEELTSEEKLKGIQGIREGVIRLLTLAAQSDSPQKQLYLFSEEPMDWMNDRLDPPGFWQSLLLDAINNGCRITIIHNLSRSPRELGEAVKRWIPSYMTGVIESYALLSKGVKLFDHTLFLFNDEYVLHATSPHTYALDDRVYILSGEMENVRTYHNQFQHLLESSRPLLRSSHLTGIEDYYDTIERMITAQPKKLYASEVLCSLFMPDHLLADILTRHQLPTDTIEQVCKTRRTLESRVQTYLETSPIRLFMTLPRITEVVKAQVPLKACSTVLRQPITYLPAEYHAHLAYVMETLRNYENLQIVLTRTHNFSEGVQILSSGNKRMTVIKDTTPSLIFTSEEPDFCHAVYRFLSTQFSHHAKKRNQKSHVLEKLETFSDTLMKKMRGRMLP